MTRVEMTKREITALRRRVIGYYSYTQRHSGTVWNDYVRARAVVQAHWDKFHAEKGKCGLPVLCQQATAQDIKRNAELRKIALSLYRQYDQWTSINQRLSYAMARLGRYPDGKLKNGKPVNFSAERKTVERYQALRAKLKKAKQ